MNTGISCIIPTHNRKISLVLETLLSVANQTKPPLEIIIVDNSDVPVDESLFLKHLIGIKASVYRIVSGAGVAQARNFGAAVARGGYLAFLDDDDLWSKTYLEKVREAFSQGAEIVISRLDKLENGKISLHKNATGRLTIEKLLMVNPGVTGSNTAISRPVFFALGGFDVRLVTSEDKSLIIDALRRQMAIVVLPENQVIMRVHAGPRLSDPLKVVEGLRAFVRKYYKLMPWKARLKNWEKIYYNRTSVGQKIYYFPYWMLLVFNRMLAV